MKLRILALIFVLIYAISVFWVAKEAHGQVIHQMDPTYEVPAPCAKYIDEIEKYDWDMVMVTKIMYAESKCNPNSVNRFDSHKKCSGSYGLLQLACIHKGGDKLDPKENIRMAYEVYEAAGGSFSPWTTYRAILKRK